MERGERGSITIWMLGVCVAVLFLGGISGDLWRAVETRRALQSMADAGATAGADGLDPAALRDGTLALDPARVRALVYATVVAQPQSRLVTRSSVSVTGNVVVVRLHATVRFGLLRVFLRDEPFDVTAEARAEPRRR